MNILKQSTAATIKLGPFVDDTDGKTAETALTIGQADIRLSKNGGDIAQTNNATGATHDELGYYDIPLNTTDTGTLGRLRVLVSKAGALPVWQDFLIVTANVFDTFCSTGSLNVNAASLSTDAITAASVKADAVTKIQNGVTLATSQPAITWGQQKIIADVEEEGALHIENTNGDGIGQFNSGGLAGVSNYSGNGTGMMNEGKTGLSNAGTSTGVSNRSSNGTGMMNEGKTGLRNIGSIKNVTGFDADMISQIQSGLAIQDSLQTVDTVVAAIKAKTDNLPASPAAVGSAMTLTAAYDKAKDDVLTPLGVVDGIVDAIKVQTDKIPATPASAGEYTANIGAIKAKTDNLPLSPASSGEYTSALTTIQNDLDNPNQYKADVSNLALQATSLAIKGQTDKIPAAPAQTGEYNAALTAIQADLDNPTQYKADVSGLATTAHVQEVEDKVDIVDGIADAILDDTGTTGVLLSTSALGSIFDDEVIVGTYTFSDLLKIMAAALAGKATGGGTTAVTFRGVDDSSDVIVATVDANGNRSAVTLTV